MGKKICKTFYNLQIKHTKLGDEMHIYNNGDGLAVIMLDESLFETARELDLIELGIKMLLEGTDSLIYKY